MAGLAVGVVLGAAATAGSAGCVAGLVAAGTAVLLGPHAADIVPHRISAAALLALGCAGWLRMSNEADMHGPSLPGDFIVVALCAKSAVAGYAVACAALLGTSALWHGAVPCAPGRTGLLALVVVVVAITCILLSL